MERIKIVEKKDNIYAIKVETGKPDHYYANKRIELNGEIYRIIKMGGSTENNGQRKHMFLAYKRPQVGKYDYNGIPFDQIVSLTRETPLINLITLSNTSEIRYGYDNRDEALAEFNIIKSIIQEERTYPWKRLI